MKGQRLKKGGEPGMKEEKQIMCWEGFSGEGTGRQGKAEVEKRGRNTKGAWRIPMEPTFS